MAPVIQAEITGGEVVIAGSFSDTKAEALAKKLNDAVIR
jgi:preprotein translocase subunit SecD